MPRSTTLSRSPCRAGLLLCGLLASAPAFAQGISSNADAAREGEEIKGDTKVAEIDEIERGFYLSVDYGPNYFIPIAQPGFVLLNPDYVRPGTRMGVRAGFDILNNIRFDLFVLANFNEGVISQDDIKAQRLTGDLAHFAPGAAIRFDFITSQDQRLFTYVRVGAGYAIWFPAQLAASSAQLDKQDFLGSVHTDASLGIEYYTKLRHLSAGIEVDFQALIAPFAFGVSVYPTLKYTF